ncbi:MAG TPA: hypothetical protein VJB59_09520 [Bdellovibrionota bacterium]|nr:hypothetical protein [Bdellovibrionota bacterium]
MKLLSTLALIVFFKIAGISSCFASSLEISLRAHFDDRTVWTISMVSQNYSGCTLRFKRNKEIKRVQPGKENCREIAKLANELRFSLAPPEILTAQSESPEYELIVGTRRVPTFPLAAEECRILPSGKESCSKRNFTKAEKLTEILARHAVAAQGKVHGSR